MSARSLDDDSVLRACVGDFGTWLPAGNPERVFDGFFLTKREGMGIGLFIARDREGRCDIGGGARDPRVEGRDRTEVDGCY
jgi:C4-dicarboxylate-specific signal transduction histidine kinase